MRRRSAFALSGFTLIELMVVVAVIAVLAAIAVPAYQAQVRKGRRTDARSALLDLAGREERYYASSNTYITDMTQLGYAGAANQTIGAGYYSVTVVAGPAGIATGFVGVATPVAGSTQLADTECQYFSVDNTGTQVASSSIGGPGADTTADCWH